MTTIGARALQWSLDQMGRENPPSHETVAEWFSHAERGGRPLGITSGNHCAVGASAAAFATCGSKCDAVPHGFRAAVMELKQDAESAGAWVPKGSAFVPSVGDLAVYHRGDEGGWLGHVNRVISADDRGYTAIGANEGSNGLWAINSHEYDQASLLGFVHYPQVQIISTASMIGIGLATSGVIAAIFLTKR
jgi:hypothetical protein